MAMLPQTSSSLHPTAYQAPPPTPAMKVRPATVIPEKTRIRVSEADYWETYYNDSTEHQYEWNNGYLEEKPMPDHVSYLMYKWLVNLLERFLEVQPLAKTIGLEMGFRLVLPRKIVIRKPDLGVVLNSNPVPLGPTDFSYQGIFDLCLESLSYSKPSEVKRDTVLKKREYARGGVPEYYILDARGKKTAFYQLTARGIYQPIPPTSAGLICSKVLPGFQFRLTDLQRQPSLEQLSEDPVYSSFALPALLAARRAQQVAERAQQVAERAQQIAESEVQKEQEARRQETIARQLAEAQVRDVETKLRQLEAELASLRHVGSKP